MDHLWLCGCANESLLYKDTIFLMKYMKAKKNGACENATQFFLCKTVYWDIILLLYFKYVQLHGFEMCFRMSS